MNNLSPNKAISKLKEKHNNFYDYSKFIYLNSKELSIIICPNHGEFKLSYSQHIRGQKCKQCTINSCKFTQEQAINNLKQIHQNRYSYSKSIYTNYKNKIIITCSIHGDFNQSYSDHAQGKGCPSCGNVFRLNTKTAINKLNEIHNFKYDYSLLDYKNAKTKIKIICPVHGIFEQTYTKHQQGQGCSKCTRVFGFKKSQFISACNNTGTLYILKCFNENEEFYKIGITSKTVEIRFPSTSYMPYQYKIIQEIKDTPENIYDLEHFLHRLYKPYKYKPLKSFVGETECFKI